MAKRNEQGFGRPLHEPMLRGDLSAWLGWWPERLSAVDVLADWQTALARRGSAGSPLTVQLYVHFAFCQSSCRFCQYFHIVPRDQDQVSRYTDYAVALLDRYREAIGRTEISNAYFGGGTPSAMPTDQLARFAAAFAQTFHVNGQFTCEAHPGNLDEQKLDLLREIGVNRLSMGLQSFDAGVLKRIGRTNPPLGRVEDLVRKARDLGMWTNTDLVLGLPGQTRESFRADLEVLLSRVRPDCATVYRYQPVERLPGVAEEALRYSNAITAGVVAHAFRLGYLAEITGGDDRSSKSFLRNSRHTWWQWTNRIGYEAGRMLRANAELPVYECFENNDSHILGIGPGAVSHIYGHSWYREVTAVGELCASTQPLYVGTRLTPEDECRTALLRAFDTSRWIDRRALQRQSGVDVETALGRLLGDGVRAGALRRLGPWVSCARGASPRTHPGFFEALLPALAGDEERWSQRAVETVALRSDKDVQRELVAVGDHLRGVEVEQPAETIPPKRSDDALNAWAQLIGLGGRGQQFRDATIDRVGGGEVHFHVLPEPAPALRVIVEWNSAQPSYFSAGPFSIFYAGREDKPLSPREEEVLRELCARTTEALELPSTSAAVAGMAGR